MKSLCIIGASGHGKVVADIAKLNGYEELCFLDDADDIKECAGIPVIGKSKEAPAGDVFVAIGNESSRRALINYYHDRKQPILIHPCAVVAAGVIIGEGTVVMAGAVINPGVIIGRGCIINTSSSIDHDCLVGSYTHVSVGAHLCGTVSVGDSVWVGAGAIVSNNLSICNKVVIGAGATVVKDIKEAGVYIGTPAKILTEINE